MACFFAKFVVPILTSGGLAAVGSSAFAALYSAFGKYDVVHIHDYIADHQMNMFEDFIGYQGSAVLDEPVREENSFSKESMSQESEISENILLPDLAKQSESIEQQSGEIAERGMPT